ncbi:MAG: NAD(P)/FAD-dependent oxidoreductase [Thermocrispum sp.]
MREKFDVVVVGGGPGGLSAALTLARARRSVLVVDAGSPRNAAADGVHNYLGLEGTPPAKLLATGRAEVASYGGEVVTGSVAGARRQHGGFTVSLADGRSVLARRLVVACGLVDELPAVPGLAERFGRDVLHCPYCHGWEVADQPIGVLASGPMAVHQALLLRQWSEDIVLFTHTTPRPADDELEQLHAREIAVVEGTVTGLQITGDRLAGVRLESGEVVPRTALAVAPRFTARAELLAALGLAVEDFGMNGHVLGSRVAADPNGATGVDGVWVVGNAADLRAGVLNTASAGMTTATMVNADLVGEDTRAAVAQRRRAAYWVHG